MSAAEAFAGFMLRVAGVAALTAVIKGGVALFDHWIAWWAAALIAAVLVFGGFVLLDDDGSWWQ